MTGASKPMSGRRLRSFCALVLAVPALCAPPALAAPEGRTAPNILAAPANQLVVAGNACGPAALLNAFRAGSPAWQRASQSLAGSSDKERLLRIIREIGMRPSRQTPGRPRWSRRGVSVADLLDMANEMIAGLYLPQLGAEVFFLKPRETPDQLVRRVYQRLDTSLAKGLPPVLSLRRYALRRQPAGPPQWVVLDAHFVTLTAISRPLAKGARSFAVSYIDPWGARRCRGSIGISGQPLLADAAGRSSCLEADFPQAGVGEIFVRHGEETVLVAAAAIGRR